jgi:DNA gyrase/topoisomerase IV subunit A
MVDSERSSLEERVRTLDGVLDALSRLDEINEAVRISKDRIEARSVLVAEPFGYSEVVATHILDLNVGRQTVAGVAELRRERREAAQRLKDLE